MFFGIASFAARLLIGRLGDCKCVSSLHLIQVGSLGVAITILLLPLARAYTAFVVFSIVDGFLDGLMESQFNLVLLTTVSPQLRATAFALSLKCNKCSSKASWVDCKDEQFTCPTDMADRCVTSYVKNGDEQTFSKYCGSKEYCEYSSKATCKAAENLGASECKVTCCRGQLCNAGFAAAKISGVVMLTCVLTLLVFSNL
ncbi:unnamed protein product [Porites evermanni]|uniref:UPAR/Ly6 domain-containing protein n=1 Tax=Porites evermanni TaxID=104178 RepID=A0ABN8S9H8_9CNID|nr:unnamed protein product [Porites evermanni]